MNPLTGKELLEKTKELIEEGTNLSSCAKTCGYSSPGPNNTFIPQVSSYLKELLSSYGLSFPAGRRGRSAGGSSNIVNVFANNSLLLSKSKIRDAGLSISDELTIEFNEKDRTFLLTKIEPVTKPEVVPPAPPAVPAEW